MYQAQALWYENAGQVALREIALAPDRDAVCLRALYSGVSRGTERLVLEGQVPASEHERMRCPHQDGAFPFPVKYGYALVARIDEGPRAGETVFLLHPHQNLVLASPQALHTVPDGVPPRRAVLAANMETALNVLWDSGAGAGDNVLIVGGGVLGLLIASLAARLPGAQATVVDVAPERRAVAQALGARFATPDDAPADQDIVIHTSASEEGLALALASAGTEAKVVEASWYGARKVAVPLGEAFHARRLSLVSSQVGMVPAARRARWSHRRRLDAALALLRDPALDALITTELGFQNAPARLPSLLTANTGLMTVLRYQQKD